MVPHAYYGTDVALETQAAILRSDALAMKVIESDATSTKTLSLRVLGRRRPKPKTQFTFRAWSLIRLDQPVCWAPFAVA